MDVVGENLLENKCPEVTRRDGRCWVGKLYELRVARTVFVLAFGGIKNLFHWESCHLTIRD